MITKNFLLVGGVVAVTLLGGGLWWNQEMKKDAQLFNSSLATVSSDSNNTVKPTTMEEMPTKNPNSVSNNEVVDLTMDESITVKIKNFEYIPKNIKIKDGTTVTWINEDEIKHNVMLDHEDSDRPHDAKLGQDPTKFEGPLLAKGESYSFTFKQASDNAYHCSPHPWMKGKVEVVS